MKNNQFMQTAKVLGLLCLLNSTAYAVEPKTDFNGDGKADIFVKKVFSGALNAWFVNGTTVTNKTSLGTVSPSTGETTIAIKDANGDGKSDLYWYNSNTGNLSVWLMNGAAASAKVSLGGLSPALGWTLFGLTDLDIDNKKDLARYNVYTGQLQRWFTNGSVVTSKQIWGTLLPKNGWFPAGLKDMNGNGAAELLMYNPYMGGIAAWPDNGGLYNYGAIAPNNGWTPAGLEDFNGDGRADVLWKNIYSGEIGAWMINGSTILNYVPFGVNAPNNGWSIAGYSDFNNDGKTDIFWYNASTGGTIAWLTNIGSRTFGTLSPKQGWQPMGLDDFNGEGNSDLLWRNVYTNATSTWLLNGLGISQTANYGAVSASSVWSINIPTQ